MKAKIRKILALALTALIIVSAFAAVPFTASAAESRTESVGAKSGTTGDCTWTLDDEGVLTISGNGKMQDFEWNPDLPWGQNISKVIIENGVTSIGNYSFFECIGLTSVTIPDSVTNIGWCAFFDCTGLTSIIIPDSVTSIGYGAFSGTEWFNNNPDGLIYAGRVAYKYKGDMPENTSIIIKNGTKEIACFAFSDCIGLTSIIIPNSVTSIGSSAFFGCTGLKSVNIPDSVTSIGRYTFYICTGLTSVTIPNSVTSIGGDAFSSCTSLTSVTIPNSVTSIGGSAFSSCTGLTSVIISDSVTSIEGCAFEGCTSLMSITIPDSVTDIGEFALENTAWFDNKPDGLVYAGKVAYKYKGNMPKNTSIEIKNGTKEIANSAFAGCTGLKSVNIPDSVTSIGFRAFAFCTNLTSVTIPDSVTSIGYWAFNYCDDLKTITVSSENPVYDSRNNCNAIIETKKNTIVCGCKNTVIPDSVTSIGSSAFSDCTGLTSITIPDSVTSIDYDAFSGCTGLTSVTIPNSVTSISDFMFADCKSLKNIIVPDSVKTIGRSAFSGCTSLLSVSIPYSVTSIDYGAFSGCTGLTSVTIPDSVKSIDEVAFGYCYDDNYNEIKVDGFTIYGYEGSQAQKYAEDNGFEFVKLVTKSDESTGITLDTPEEMSVSTTLLSGQAAADAAIGLSDGYTSIAAYNIEVTKNGEVVQPENIVKVMIPCENKNARVFRKEVDGTLTDMKAVWANGYLVFYTDHFSVYIVAEEQTVKIGDTNGDDKIDINDVTVIQRCMAEYIELTAELEAVADVNGDNKVDINDATHLQKHLAEFQGVVLGKQ